MTSRSTSRPPPRRWWWPARSTLAALCAGVLFLIVGVNQAAAYPCGKPASSRTLSAAKEDCSRPTLKMRPKRKADFTSLAVFVGMVALVLFVPARYSRRRVADPE